MIIAIVDDLPREAASLENLLSAELTALGMENHSIACFSSGEQFLESWRPGEYSLIFLDIFMGGMTGAEVSSRIREQDQTVALVFFTSSTEFASHSYDVGASYYLQKPIDQGKVAAMLKRIRLDRISENRFIELPDQSRLLLRDILYTEKYRHILTFVLADGSRKSTSLTHAEVEESLCRHMDFCVTGQGNIVNLRHVSSLHKNGFLMKNDMMILIPRRKYKETKNAYYRYRFQANTMGGTQ